MEERSPASDDTGVGKDAKAKQVQLPDIVVTQDDEKEEATEERENLHRSWSVAAARKGLAHVTLEPMILMWSLAMILPNVVEEQLIIYKTCIR